MMRSMFAGVSALRNHQVRMDVIGNNIANVNTIGFKASQVNFQDLMSQTMQAATSPQGDRGGTNPFQVGLGVGLGAMTTNFNQGNTQTTGLGTDLAIEGEGFFVVGQGDERYFTRAGVFSEDRDGNLVSAGTGLSALGWMADDDGNIDDNAAIVPITVPRGAPINASAATRIDFAGNLDSRTTGRISLSDAAVSIQDDAGRDVDVSITMTPTGNFNEWRWELAATNPAGDPVVLNPADGTGTFTLDDAGNVVSGAPASITIEVDGGNPITITSPAPGNDHFSFDNGADPAGDFAHLTDWTAPATKMTSIRVFDSLGNDREVFIFFEKTDNNTWDWHAEDESGAILTGGGTVEFSPLGRFAAGTGTISIPGVGGAQSMTITPDFDDMTQFGAEATIQAVSQDGYASGSLTSINIDSRGVLVGSFSNGLTRELGQLAMATFANTGGLNKAGDSLYTVSNNSGDAQIGTPGSGSFGDIVAGSVEMSNVDLSQEFTNMIVTQRGFQANSRIITTSDEMLQELVNLKR